ncbi:hypothetical protein EJB05_08562, partial [Eragrostis curvula]
SWAVIPSPTYPTKPCGRPITRTSSPSPHSAQLPIAGVRFPSRSRLAAGAPPFLLPPVAATMDGVVSQILEQQVLSVAKAVEDKLDEEIAALERLDPDDIEALRERRILQMRRAAERRAKWRALGHGEYSEVPEKEFFAAAKASERLVCHFYRDNWPCKVLDKHLLILAKQHVETRFIKVHAEKAPFLTEKLRIAVLPTLAIVKNAKVEDYVVGFDELGGKDDFSTEDLEERLARSEIIFLDGEGPSNPSKHAAATKRSVRQSDTGNSSDSD